MALDSQSEIQWTIPLDSSPCGLSFANEPSRLLVWTESHRLLSISRDGKWQAQLDFPSTLRVAAISEDGSAIVAASTDGKIGWFDRDLKKRWERALKSKPTAVAIDPLAQVF